MTGNREPALLARFLSSAGASLRTFRYFARRDPALALAAHVFTLIGVEDDDRPVAYGHLDAADGVTWLGVCVVEGAVGRGLGGVVVRALLAYADQVGTEVCLTVDEDNLRARSLYQVEGFADVQSSEGRVLMRRVVRR